MGKKNKKKNRQQHQETAAERARRLLGRESDSNKEIEEEPTEAERGLDVEQLPADADEETLDFALKLKKEQERLKELETKLKERSDNLDSEIDTKVQERIDSLEMDLPTAQAKYKEIVEDAKNQADQIIENAKKEEELLVAKQKEIDELSEKVSKEKMQLENDKASYRIEIGNEISDKYKEQIKEIDNFDEERSKLERKVEYFKNNYETTKEALKEANDKLSDYEVTKIDLDGKNNDCKILEEKCRELQKEISELKEELSNLGSDPIEIKAKYDSLEEEYKNVLDKLKNVPSELELSELRRKAEELEKINTQYSKSQSELLDLRLKADKYEIQASQVDDYIQYVRILTESKRQLQNELESLREQYESENNNKFKALAHYDQETIEENPPTYNGSLNYIVNMFIGFAQNDNPSLYYKVNTISAFISWMACTKIIILEGLSGTGKTSLPLEFQRFAGWYTPTIPVQSAWKDRNDLVGFFNDFKKEYKETDFLKSLYKAELNAEKPALIVLDEMNISRIEYYFADFLSELEHKEGERAIDLLPDQTTSLGMPKLFREGGKLPINPNVWFIGTANKDDSTFDITDKVYDRSGVIKFKERATPDRVRAHENNVFISYPRLKYLFEQATKSPNYKGAIEKYYKDTKQHLSDQILLNCEINIGNRMMDQLDIFVPVYLACTENYTIEGVQQALDEFFPNKILRKLENEYGSNAKQMFNSLLTVFSSYKMNNSVMYLNNLLSKLD